MSDTTTDASRDFAEQAWVEVNFQPDPGYQLLFDGLHAHEDLGRPFLFEIDLSSGKPRDPRDIGKIVGTSATIWLTQSTPGVPDRFFNGIVTRAISTGLVAGAYRYRVEVRPWIWLLTRSTDCRIFQNKSAFQIITQVFRDAHFSDFEDNRRAGAGDIELEYCVQYRETSFDFVTRLMEQFGLYYYFRHDRNKHTLVIADDPNAHKPLPDEIPFVFDQTEYRPVGDHIWQWSTDLSLHTGKFTFRDYNFTTPSADLTAKTVQPGNHLHNDIEIYEYPGPYDEVSVGKKLTDVRMQAISRQRMVIDADEQLARIACGLALQAFAPPRDHRQSRLPHHPVRVLDVARRRGLDVPRLESRWIHTASPFAPFRVMYHFAWNVSHPDL